jgi:thiamine kinase-like enzyme
LPDSPSEAKLVAAVRRAVAEWLPGEAADVEPRPLTGGIGNRSFLIQLRERRWVVRLPKPASAGSVLDVTTEHRVMAQAAAAGLAPPVVGSNAATGVLVTQYIAHAPCWSAGEARWRENIVRIAAHLKSLHRLRTDLPPFVARVAAERYLTHADGAPQLAAEQDIWAVELIEAARRYDARFEARVLCHNDLVPENVLDDGRLWLIDFEYAVRASPVLDLAGLAGMNDFDAPRRKLLIDAYFAGESPGFGLDEFDEAVHMVRLLAFFWAVACRERAEDPEPFAAFAEHMAAVLRN